MFKFLWLSLSRVLGFNLRATPKSVISQQLDELRPLPIGRDQFMEWSERIISGALVDADSDSQRFALASMVLQMGPNDAFRADKHFVSQLRKVAANQTAHTMAQEFKLAAQKRFEDEKASLLNAVPDVTVKATPEAPVLKVQK
jgi:hypothetical protein